MVGRGCGLELVRPSVEVVPSYIEALKAGPFSHMALGGFGDEPVQSVSADPAGYIERLTDQALRTVVTPNGQTFLLRDHSIRWAVDRSGSFVGGLSFRYDLGNPLIDSYCGHVGMSVRADLRNQGFGTRLWPLVLRKFAAKGFASIIASANIDNPASIRSIERAGGVAIGRNDLFGYGEAFVYRVVTERQPGA
jgi:predicted acetyltransferase